MPKIQALYSRVSTDMQRDKGLSVPRQKEWLEEEAKKHGFIHFKHFADNGYSAASTNRPAFRDLLSKIEDGLMDAVVVYKFDRLARNVQDLLDFVDLLNKHSIKFISISENLDTTTPTGRLILTVLGSLAEWERSITVERVKDVMYDKANRGHFCGGQPPYGYDVKDKHLVINEIEAKIVRKIFDKFEEFRSFRKVVIWLNDRGYLTKRGQSWPSATVKRILISHVYKGYYTYGKRAGGSKVYLPQDRW
ncbi:MAG: recombinase family protein [Candidatus Omnitrophica bacterium]|nr:recombinase family protein [Candidatus Omnitrophota bacterium]